MADNNDEEIETELKIFDTVNFWLESNEYRPKWLRPLPLLIVAIIFTVTGLSTIGFGILFGYTVWVLVTTPKKMRIAFDMVQILKPALLSNPKGLEDTQAATEILNNAKIYETSSKNRKYALKNYLQSVFKKDSTQEQCDDEHSVLCSHKVSAETVKFWKNVASQPLF